MRDEELARQAEFLHHDFAVDIGIFEHIEPPRGFMSGTIAHRELAVARTTLAWDIMRAAACHSSSQPRVSQQCNAISAPFFKPAAHATTSSAAIFPDAARADAHKPLKTAEGHHTVTLSSYKAAHSQ